MDKRRVIHEDQIQNYLFMLERVFENSSPEFFKTKAFKDQESITNIILDTVGKGKIPSIVTKVLQEMKMLTIYKSKKIAYRWNPEKCKPNPTLAIEVIHKVRQSQNEYNKINRQKQNHPPTPQTETINFSKIIEREEVIPKYEDIDQHKNVGSFLEEFAKLSDETLINEIKKRGWYVPLFGKCLKRKTQRKDNFIKM